MFHLTGFSRAFHHLLSSGNSAKPAVDSAENFEDSLYFARGTGIGIENLWRVDSLHKRW